MIEMIMLGCIRADASSCGLRNDDDHDSRRRSGTEETMRAMRHTLWRREERISTMMNVNIVV
jgi:hypothetical protein